MLRKNVEYCSFPKWYLKFKDVTIKSKTLKIPGTFLEYLKMDEFLVPDAESPAFSGIATKYDFESFENDIRNAIASLGGYVLPKLNWSSPKDATWISYNKSLLCEKPVDIYFLLKSSNFVSHDLADPFRHCIDKHVAGWTVDYELILRQWIDINPAGEFRCFVVNNKLVAMCQRYRRQFFNFLKQDIDSISSEIQTFFKTYISGKFLDTNFTFDVFREKMNKVLLVDFSPMGEVTDPILFDWKEIEELGAASVPEPSVRIVQSESEGNAGSSCVSGFPTDFSALASMGTNPYNSEDVLKLFPDGQSSSEEES